LAELSNLDINSCSSLQEVEGLEDCSKIWKIYTNEQGIRPYAFLGS
jgi:hypothetical protein